MIGFVWQNLSLLQAQEILTTFIFNNHTAIDTFKQIYGWSYFDYTLSYLEVISVNLNCLDQELEDYFTLKLLNKEN